MKEKRNLLAGAGLIAAFALWTVLIQRVDVQAVGQNGTKIGFADFNVWFHQLTGVHMTIYTITDWLGLVAENIGTSPSYVNKIVRSKEQIMNKTFLAMMEDLGFDVELHYVERGKEE